MVALKQPGAAAQFLTDAGLLPGEVFAVASVLALRRCRAQRAGPRLDRPRLPGRPGGRRAGLPFQGGCLAAAQPFVRDGLPIRAELPLLGLLGRAPT